MSLNTINTSTEMEEFVAKQIKTARMAPVTGIKLYVPELFKNPVFRQWLESSRCMTWHSRGTDEEITEDDFADVAIFIDPSLAGDGTDSDMPGHDAIVSHIKEIYGPGPLSCKVLTVILSNAE